MYDLLLKLKINSNKLKVLGSEEKERDFIFVQDAVTALLLVAYNDRANGKTFNAGIGTSTSIRDLVELIQKILCIEPEVIFTETS